MEKNTEKESIPIKIKMYIRDGGVLVKNMGLELILMQKMVQE